MIARTHSLAMVGLNAFAVEVEADVNLQALPQFQIVGLPDTAVSESRERVRSALRSSGLEFPSGRITVNLAPADLRKEGPCFDLPIALAIAAANGKVEAEAVSGVLSLGELSLDGRVRGVHGILSAAIHHHRAAAAASLFLPHANAAEASCVRGLRFVPLETLQQAAAILNRQEAAPDGRAAQPAAPPTNDLGLDFSEVRGQEFACRALQIAAAGGHNALLLGPPGSGKSMLAQRLPTIMPPLDEDEALEVTQIYSVAGLLDHQQGIVRVAPFRAPHHSCSAAGLIGGGSSPRPGEISLAHCGVLFLDEALEFPRHVLETLRQPLESGSIVLSRAQQRISYPARITLVLALNPCPCGFYGDTEKPCRCSPPRIDRYRGRLSGPLADRIDLHHEVARRNLLKREEAQPAPPSARLLEEVLQARERQRQRGGTLNARLGPSQVAAHCALSASALQLLRATADTLGWSQRAHQRVLRVARTIADLHDSDRISDDHVAEAIAHRRALMEVR